MSGGHLFLIGFMGSGKSTVACRIAGRLGQPCVDLDEQVEAAADRTVAQIFEQEGEQSFRDRESAALRSLEEADPSVVACGGGIVLRPENRALLKRMGRIVYLVVTTEVALSRIGDATTRPLLAGPGGTLAATSLLAAREALYRSLADFSIDTVGLSPDEVADRILAHGWSD